MKSILLATGALVVSALVAAPAATQARPRTIDMGCAQAAMLVWQNGAVVLTTYPNQYDRYVRDLGFCPTDMHLQPEWVPTRDTPQCFIGYTCFQPSPGGLSDG